jgi:tetratricopeptide (TPR) repeat protein
MSKEFKKLVTKSLPTAAPVRPKELQHLHIDPTGGKQARTDYASTLDDLARQARQQSANSGPAKLVAGGRGFVLQEVSGTFRGLETPTARRLREAKAKIDAGDFAGASQLLQEVLREHPAHVEAHFLSAECELGLGLHEPALQRLHGLRATGVQPEMTTRIDDLCLRVIDALWPALFERCTQQALAGQSRAAIDQVQRFVGWCPRAAMLHYLLAMMQMMAGDVEQAARSIETAVRTGRPHEMTQLMRLKDDIGERLAVQQMGRATELFKAGQYRAAREFLASLDVGVQRAKLCRMFASFLQACEGGRTDQPAAPTLEEAEPLYEFILAKELRVIQTAPTIAEAEQTARSAVGWLPQYPYAHFLYARTRYDCSMEEVLGGSPPPLEKLLGDLRLAASHAERAIADPGIKSAPEMLAGLQALVSQLETIAAQMAEQQREAAIVNPVLDEFINLMESAQRSIGSVEELRGARASLQAVQRKIGPARKQVKSQAALEVLQDLDDVIQANLKQLNDIEAEIQEAEHVNALIKQYVDLMEGMKKGTPSRDRLQSVKRELQSIQSKVPGVRGKLKSPEALKELQDFERVLKDQLAAVEEAVDAPPDVEIVNGLFERFATITEPLKKSSSLRKPSQTVVMRVVQELMALKVDCEKARSKASPQGKKLLDELISTISQILP